ncbi:uncharacterized protein LOC26528173 isoform X2 [Drosophila mojavensis]|nr:uncharacterized protein LOC26528173 isoform X2 [Drosophila mojavensis]
MEKDFLTTTNEMNIWQKPEWRSRTQSERIDASTTFRPTPAYPWLSKDQFSKFPNNLKTDEMKSNIPLRARSRINDNFKIEPRAARRYYPVGTFAAVCASKSTVYNVPKVMDWLGRNMYVNVTYETKGALMNDRPIWYDLRFYLYTVGRSEECHSTELATWKPYLECALLRNQRMEYMIPKYPLHQLGYIFRYTKQMDERPYNKDSSYKPRYDWKDYWAAAD